MLTNQSTPAVQIPDRFYVISTEFLSLSRRRSSWRNVLSGKGQGETAVFASYSPCYLQKELTGSIWLIYARGTETFQ